MFCTVTDYEYLLPAGWKLGTTTSDGSTWIGGGNSVTVTSDLSTGDGADIRIRASNRTCGSGLAVNGPVSTVRISRPAPTLSVTGNQTTICSGCETFTINGMPSGASVQWSLSNTTDAYINGCSTCSTVSVCRNSTTNTIVTLSATVSHCTFTYPPVTHDISLGITAPTSIDFQLIDPTFGKIRAITSPVTGATSYNWYINGSLNLLYHSNGATFSISNDCDIEYDISVEAVNACGTSSQTHANAYVPCDNYYMVSPNPASGDVTVSADQTKSAKGTNTTFGEVRLYDMQGNLKKYQKVNKVKTAKINIAGLTNGTYFVEIINGSYKERKQLLIQK